LVKQDRGPARSGIGRSGSAPLGDGRERRSRHTSASGQDTGRVGRQQAGGSAISAERLRRLTEAELTGEQLDLHRAITSGPRAAGPQLFELQDEHGALNGPFGVMLHAPGLGGPLQELGAAVRYRTRLSDRTREVAILATATATGSEFERYAHEPIGRAAGLTAAELAALRDGTFTSTDPTEAAGYAVCRRLLDTDPRQPWSDEEYAAAADTLGSERLLELTVLVGYYRTLAQLMQVFAIGAPATP
jgi:4-carboxymuconolactone decarboxylase